MSKTPPPHTTDFDPPDDIGLEARRKHARILMVEGGYKCTVEVVKHTCRGSQLVATVQGRDHRGREIYRLDWQDYNDYLRNKDSCPACKLERSK